MSPARATVEYPLLGEPTVVELCNTLYVDPDGTTDFLGDLELTRGWFAALDPPILDQSHRLDECDRRAVVRLRDAARGLFEADAGAMAPPDGAMATLEEAVHRTRSRLTLDWQAGVGFRTGWERDTGDPASVISRLALAAIEVLVGERQVRTCDRPACQMRYFQQHRRRRYCNPACANADRQHRFHDRHRRTRAS